jgi:DNA-binding transcriptional LysR family regulator
MELRALEYFVAVAEEGSFTKAAARCEVAQPSISYQVQNLERELGEALFDRDSRRVTLSPGGRALLPYARTCLGAVRAAKAEFTARSGLLTGELSLATVDGVDGSPLPSALRTFHQRYPAVRVSLGGGTSASLLTLVRQGRLDAAIVAHPRRTLPTSLESHWMQGERIVALVREDSPLAEADALDLAHVRTEKVITYARESVLHPIISRACDEAGVPLVVSYATNDVGLQVALAREGIGVALSAGSDPAVRHARGVVRLPILPAIAYEKNLVWRREPAPAAPLRAFLEICAEQPV